MTDREQAVVQSFVALANSLVEPFDVVELLGGLTADCTRLLDIASAGVLLGDASKVLHVVAASSEATRDLELFQVQQDEGPCRDCYREGTPVKVADLGDEAERWPNFVEKARAAGFASVHAVPIRLHDDVLGALGLFGRHVGALSAADVELAQALAHVGSIAIVHRTALADKTAVAEQLQSALHSRVVLEQAKGLLAQQGNLEMDQAFEVLRSYARHHNERLADVAQCVVKRQLDARSLLGGSIANRGTPKRSPSR